MDNRRIRAMSSDFDKWFEKYGRYYLEQGLSVVDIRCVFFAGFEACDKRVETYSDIVPEHKEFKKDKTG